MSLIEVDFGANAFPKLSSLGLRVPALRNSVCLRDTSSLEAPLALFTGLDRGSHVSVGAFCSIVGGEIGNVNFGRYCSVGTGIKIGAHEHPTDWLTTSRLTHVPQMHDWHSFMRDEAEALELAGQGIPFPFSCPTTNIGHDVWIGGGVSIKAGVTIGDGAIIGARSLVVKDVAPYSIVGGVPAKLLRMRFSDKIIEDLMDLRWWDYSLYDAYPMSFDHIERAIGQLREKIAAGDLKPFTPPKYGMADLQKIFQPS
jgi:acetyltransferase-like isoleucine patch superfamily enzyme